MRGKAVTFRPHTALVSGSLELTEPDVEEKLQVQPTGKTKTPLSVLVLFEARERVAAAPR